jgi:Autographiviridae endonuclease VII
MSKICTECKLLTDNFQKDSRKLDGLNAKCKVCVRKRRMSPKYREYDLAYNKKYAIENAEHVTYRTRNHNIKKLYGLTQEQFIILSASQQDCCKICKIHVSKTRYPNLCVDHDHTTGKIRGLLCDNCNRGIGLMGDTLENLESAVIYFRSSRSVG